MHPGTMLTDAARAFWPTVSARDGDPRRAATHPESAAWRNKVARGAVNRAGMLSDDLSSSAAAWPTPAARDYKGANSSTHLEVSRGSKHLDQLPNFVAHLWATPNVPNGGRVLDDETTLRKGTQEDGTKRQVDLGSQVRLWSTPRAEDSECCGNHPGAMDSLTGQSRLWPTPAATPYGSSQNGINGHGGAHERPSANTPSLERLSHSFLPRLAISTDGDACSPSALSSPPPSPIPKAKLNAQFVEYLMGLPIGWTGSALAATAWSHWRQRMRSSLLRLARS
jgi:hypothetical protein